MWFGKKEVMKAASGIGSWIDEQQFTPQEQLEAKLKLFGANSGFKIVQRILATWIMHVWAFWALNLAVAFWYSVAINSWLPIEKMIEIIMTPFLWAPCFGVFTMYLSGGLAIFKQPKK